MRTVIKGRRARIAGAVAAAYATCAIATTAHADLRMDLRATAVNGVPISREQTQHFIPNVL